MGCSHTINHFQSQRDARTIPASRLVPLCFFAFSGSYASRLRYRHLLSVSAGLRREFQARTALCVVAIHPSLQDRPDQKI